MIIYKDVLNKLKKAGFSTTQLRRRGLLSESTISRIRKNESITTESLDVICVLLHCQPNDVMEVSFPQMKIQNRELKSCE